jgi:hypothetical protein
MHCRTFDLLRAYIISAAGSASLRTVSHNRGFRSRCYAIWSEFLKTQNNKEREVLQFVMGVFNNITNERNGVSCD